MMDKEREVSADEILEQEEKGTLAVLARAEINQQISTAKAHPRSVTNFLREAEQLATMNEEMARACVYALPRGGKTIEGPSARFAEIIAYSFGNMRYGARPVLEDGEFITSQGVAYDLERNNGVTIEVRRRITDSKGARYNADMIGVTANAANSIALRNAVLKIIPKALWNPVYQKARQTIMGKFETFQNRLATMFQEFVRYGVTKEMLCAKMGKKGVADIKIEDMVIIGGMLTALQEGETSPEEMFSHVEQVQQPRSVEQPQPVSRVADGATEYAVAPEQPKDEQKPKKRRAADAEAATAMSDTQPGAPIASLMQPPTNGETPVTANMVKQITLRLESYGVDEQKLRAKFGVGEIKELPQSKVREVLDWIEQVAT